MRGDECLVARRGGQTDTAIIATAKPAAVHVALHPPLSPLPTCRTRLESEYRNMASPEPWMEQMLYGGAASCLVLPVLTVLTTAHHLLTRPVIPAAARNTNARRNY